MTLLDEIKGGIALAEQMYAERGLGMPWLSAAAKARIVACVNACEGISNELLNSPGMLRSIAMRSGKSVLPEVAELRAKRDELAALLQAVLSDCQPPALQAEGIIREPKRATIAAIRAALAKVPAP